MAVRIHGTFGSWLLPQGASVLGRGSDCGVRIDDPRLSRGHARFTVTGHQLEVEDAGSRNGVLVDGTRIHGRREVVHGQVVVCGPVVLMVSIDQTQPHPRVAEGAQDPTTRRTTLKTDTEAMLDPVTSADRPGSSSRAIDPGILAAVASGSDRPAQFDQARQSALQPASAPGSITSPLEAVRPGPKAPVPRRAPTTTSHLLAPELQPTTSGALESPYRGGVTLSGRLGAGVLDGLLGAVPAVCGALLIIAVLAMALFTAGAGIDRGMPRLGHGPAASLGDLLIAVLTVEGLEGAADQVKAAAAASVVAAAVIIIGAALAAMLAAAGLLFLLVVPTVERGAPWAHRRHGLLIVRGDGSGSLGYGRALLRWVLAVLLWPLALPCVLAGMRAPHDLLSGCRVVARQG
ncbi:MAG TPA: hypothetical protein DCS97_01375 [Planctomycetes bacterium]|nr:hypothetical protein [Planctomycetota bacterium]